ncbi:MAG: response regulator [Bryobacteraceae bacterium]
MTPATTAHNRRALVVDDSIAMRRMLTFALNSWGFEVAEGGNGVEGLQLLREATADLIVADVNMPEMDGLTFVRRVRSLPGHRFTPVLMLTTESTSAKVEEGRAAGATGWLVKPFKPERLLEVVRKILP